MGGEKKGGEKPKKAEKKEDKSTGVIQSRIGQRSCRLRDRTQNDAGAPPRSGMRHRRQSRCTCERVRMVAVAFVVGARAKTTMTMRKMNVSSTVSTFLMTFGRLRPVRNHKDDGQHTNPRPSGMTVSQIQKRIRNRRKVFNRRWADRKRRKTIRESGLTASDPC